MTPLEKIYNKVANETGVHKYQVEDIFKSQFELVEIAMAEKEDIAVRIFKLFTFRVKPGRRERLNQQLKNKDAWKSTIKSKRRKVSLQEILK